MITPEEEVALQNGIEQRLPDAGIIEPADERNAIWLLYSLIKTKLAIIAPPTDPNDPAAPVFGIQDINGLQTALNQMTTDLQTVEDSLVITDGKANENRVDIDDQLLLIQTLQLLLSDYNLDAYNGLDMETPGRYLDATQGRHLYNMIQQLDNVFYYATPKVYGSLEELQALPDSEKVIGASYKVYANGQGSTYEYRAAGTSTPQTINTQLAQLREATETYTGGQLDSRTTVNGSQYALLSGTFNAPGSTYLEAVFTNGSYVAATGAEVKTLDQLVYSFPDQPPTDGIRKIYTFSNATTAISFTYTPLVFEFILVTQGAATATPPTSSEETFIIL